jgi:tetratricopeptide (TPR) repeat protein
MLQSLFADGQELPETSEAAIVFAYRALARSMAQEDAAAKEDAQIALRLSQRSIAIRIIVGDAYVTIGDYEAARHLWNRSLFELESRRTGGRRALLLRLARLEHEHGEPAAALRLWRKVLEIDSENFEAQSGIRDLTGRSF